jgi:hypothetical protein
VVPGGSPGAPAAGSGTGPSAAPSADPGDRAVANAEQARVLADAPLPERLQAMGQSAFRHSGLPLGALLLLAVFLLLQGRVDRRDPKLALAPDYGEPDVPFGSPPDDHAAPTAARPDNPTEIPR